jgi:hypothetical protein
MKNKKNLLWLSTAAIVTAACFASFSCNKKFDEPPTSFPVDVTPNTTIQQLKALHSAGGMEQITDSAVIGGVVVADDSSGNFYKQIVIEDATGGIAVALDAYDLYTKYPVGTKIYIKAKGLYLGDYNGWVEIGGGIGTSSSGNPQIDGLASALFNTYIETGTRGNVVVPHVVSVSDLTTNLQDQYQSTLIQLNNFEFGSSDTAKTYAIPGNSPQSVGFTIQDCSGNSITLYNSGYADFAGLSVPDGNGTITGIYAPYGSSKQILIRDTSDVQFTGTRCNGGGGGGNGTLTTIANILSMYSGSGVKLGAYKISGTVISDASNKNISTGAVVIEDGSYKGVEIYFGGTIGYNVGDSVVIDVTADSLIKYKGSFEIEPPYGTAQPAPVATGRTVVPQTVTIDQLNTNLAQYEYVLVKITGATYGGSLFSDEKNITDASSSTGIQAYTSKSATFYSSSVPSGSHTWICFPSFYNSYTQIQVRSASDVQ